MILEQKKWHVAPIIENLCLCVASFIFLAICENTKFRLPVSPVFVTMHTFAVFVIGAMLPRKIALGCFVAYLIEGVLGSPIFGFVLPAVATGYYVGMIVALYYLTDKRKKGSLLLHLIIAELIILFFGVLYLQFSLGWLTAIRLGTLPFVLGDAFKLALAYTFIGKLSQRAKA